MKTRYSEDAFDVSLISGIYIYFSEECLANITLRNAKFSLIFLTNQRRSGCELNNICKLTI